MFSFTVLYFQIDNLKIDFAILCRPHTVWVHQEVMSQESSWCVVWTNNTQQRLVIELEG